MNAAPFQPGDILDGYEIVDLLGRGGMGVVYRARRPGGPDVALKTLFGEVASEEADRFRREVELLSALRHPGIVPVIGSGRARGVLYYAMAIVEGESLEAKIRREGRLAPPQAARIVTQVAEAIGYAHERKIVHRDLKPANVLLDAQGRAVVTDFGLGRDLEDEQDRLTRTGEVLGTPYFMAPEQALGNSRHIDERADVYGLGAILYCALAGHPPFVGPTPLATIKLVRTSPPHPIEGLAPALEELLARVLAKSPDDRPQTALDFARELADALESKGRRSLPRGLVAGVLALAAVCVVATGALVSAALERRRASSDGASPSPVSSATAARPSPTPNPALAAALGEVLRALDRTGRIDQLVGNLRTLLAAAGEADRDQIAAATEPLLRKALACREADRFEAVARLDLKLPPESPLRQQLAKRWLELARTRVPRISIDRNTVLQKIVAGQVGDPKTLQSFHEMIRLLEPSLAALARARAVDPAVGFFPPELEPLLVRTDLGARVAASGSFREDWVRAFQGLEKHPLLGFVEAKAAIGELARKDEELIQELGKSQLEALRALGHPRAEGADPTYPEILAAYRAIRAENPESEAVKAADATFARIQAERIAISAQARARALEHVERALDGLSPPPEHPVPASRAARFLAEMLLAEIGDALAWAPDGERCAKVLLRLAELVPESSQAFARPYAEAAAALARAQATNFAGADSKALTKQYEDVKGAAGMRHFENMTSLFDGLGERPTDGLGGGR